MICAAVRIAVGAAASFSGNPGTTGAALVAAIGAPPTTIGTLLKIPPGPMLIHCPPA